MKCGDDSVFIPFRIVQLFERNKRKMCIYKKIFIGTCWAVEWRGLSLPFGKRVNGHLTAKETKEGKSSKSKAIKSTVSNGAKDVWGTIKDEKVVSFNFLIFNLIYSALLVVLCWNVLVVLLEHLFWSVTSFKHFIVWAASLLLLNLLPFQFVWRLPFLVLTFQFNKMKKKLMGLLNDYEYAKKRCFCVL